MVKENYNVIGVMSGTSLDGLDLAYITFRLVNGSWSYDIKETATIPYNKEWLEKLKTAVSFGNDELIALNKEYTELLAKMIRFFIEENHLVAIDAVCSHGHTILHQPHNKLTLQIGNLPSIAQFTGQKVVCDFRVQDVAMGGQGAPLVPIGDGLLFKDYYFCLNLGGFSNISFDAADKRLAFDICPVNTVLNYYANQLGYEYDDKGEIARSGTVSEPMLNDLNLLEFYKLPYPKSLGFEFVKTTILPLIEKYDIAISDKLATYTVHVAQQLAKSIAGINDKGSVLVTGGGAYNSYLIEKLRELLPDSQITIPDDKTIQYKEALIFGLLGVLKLRGEINVLASVTGAPSNHSSGNIYTP